MRSIGLPTLVSSLSVDTLCDQMLNCYELYILLIGISNDITSLKWLTVAMPLLESSRRQERDKTRVRLERDYRDMEDGLS